MNPYVDDHHSQDLEIFFRDAGIGEGRINGSPNMNTDMAQCNEFSLSEYEFGFDSGYTSTKDCERRNAQNDSPPEYTCNCSDAGEDANSIEQRNSYVYAKVNKVNKKDMTINDRNAEIDSEFSLNCDDSSCKGSSLNSDMLTDTSNPGDISNVRFSDSETSCIEPTKESLDDEDDTCKHGTSLEENAEGNSADDEDIEQDDDAAMHTKSDDLQITVTETGEMFVRILDPVEKPAVCDVPKFYI